MEISKFVKSYLDNAVECSTANDNDQLILSAYAFTAVDLWAESIATYTYGEDNKFFSLEDITDAISDWYSDNCWDSSDRNFSYTNSLVRIGNTEQVLFHNEKLLDLRLVGRVDEVVCQSIDTIKYAVLKYIETNSVFTVKDVVDYIRTQGVWCKYNDVKKIVWSWYNDQLAQEEWLDRVFAQTYISVLSGGNKVNAVLFHEAGLDIDVEYPNSKRGFDDIEVVIEDRVPNVIELSSAPIVMGQNTFKHPCLEIKSCCKGCSDCGSSIKPINYNQSQLSIKDIALNKLDKIIASVKSILK